MTDYNSIPGLRWSTLKRGLESELALELAYSAPSDDKPAYRTGRAAHRALLTPELGDPPMVPAEHLTPSGDVSKSKATLAWLDEQRAAGVEFTAAADWTNGQRMAAAAALHPVAAETLDLCRSRERVVLWTEQTEAGEIACKAQVDLYDERSGILADYKTHGRGAWTAHTLGRVVSAFDYAGQLAWYTRGLRANGLPVTEWRIVFQQSAAPHDCAVLDLTDWQEYGTELAERALGVEVSRRLRRAAGLPAAGAFPALTVLPLPGWLADADDDDGAELEGLS